MSLKGFTCSFLKKASHCQTQIDNFQNQAPIVSILGKKFGEATITLFARSAVASPNKYLKIKN